MPATAASRHRGIAAQFSAGARVPCHDLEATLRTGDIGDDHTIRRGRRSAEIDVDVPGGFDFGGEIGADGKCVVTMMRHPLGWCSRPARPAPIAPERRTQEPA